MKTHLDKCPTCGSRKIRLVKKDLEFTHRGRKVIVPQVECEECPNCSEVITDYAANQYIDSVVLGQKRKQSREAGEHAILRKQRKRLSHQAQALITEQARP